MINILDKSIADKIAAGEVVERPLSIVKELIENAIDAGAKKIVVEIKNGGKSYIRITDDGCGILPEDCEKAFMRHATSKITTVSDLDSIGTIGFRGEALASICAVSRTELLTKVRGLKTGRKVVVEGGQIAENQMFGCPDGTTFIVRDLFYNTPARLKFLKSDNAESSAVIEFVTHIALAYPDIKIRMINNDKILFSTNGKGNRLKTIETLTSKVHTSSLIPFSYEENGINIEGYVSGPGESRNSRKSQIFFVNGRVINSKVIEKGIKLAYSERLFEGRFPICYLFINVDPKTMDVNIHPNKREVRFYDESVITQVVRSGIITALNSKDAVPEVKEKPVKEEIFKKPLEENKNQVQITAEEISAKKERDIPEGISSIKESVDINYILSTFDKSKEIPKKQAVKEEIEIKKFKIEKKEPFDFTSLKIIGQFFNTYIQLCDDDSIYFVDQHAAHERIFYEKFINQYNDKEKALQTILLPIVINVQHGDKQKEDTWLGPLREFGFAIEEFGPLAYRITEIPMYFSMEEAENFLNDFIDNLDDYKDFRDIKTLDKIATKACKAAVKANDKLTFDEIKALLKDMTNCNNPYSCPHGRPVFIKITKSDMEKRFKRT